MLIGGESPEYSAEFGGETAKVLGHVPREFVFGEHTVVAKGFEQPSLEEIYADDVVVDTLGEHAGRLEAEQIAVGIFKTDSAIEFREVHIPTDDSDRVTSTMRCGATGSSNRLEVPGSRARY